jgi:hypothetical protein
MTVKVNRYLDYRFEDLSLIGGIGLPRCAMGAGRAAVAQVVRNLEVCQDCRSAVVAEDRVMVGHWGQQMGRNQGRVNREMAAVTGPVVPLPDLLPKLFARVVAWPSGSARGTDETARAVAMQTPVDLSAACQAPHRLGEGFDGEIG